MMLKIKNTVLLIIVVIMSPLEWALSETPLIQKPTVDTILPISSEDDGRGGLIVSNINSDPYKEILVTQSDSVTAVDRYGNVLWQNQVTIQVTTQSEKFGLPGWHGPGIQVADIGDDGEPEVLYLTVSGYLHIVSGTDGQMIKKVKLKPPEGVERWEHLVVANFRGQGDRDLLLQASNSIGYRMGHHLAAYDLERLIQNNQTAPLWTRDDFLPAAHNGARVADLDEDGRDEVISGSIIGFDGRKHYELEKSPGRETGHIAFHCLSLQVIQLFQASLHCRYSL